MVFGYAGVSTNEQNLDLQLDAFLKEGIPQKNIYTDKVSNAKENRETLRQSRRGIILIKKNCKS